MTNVQPNHFEEWSQGSGVPDYLINANVRSLSSRDEISSVLGWNYKHDCGWFVSGIDPQSGEKRRFGQFKADQPIQVQGKTAKYLTPKGCKSEGIFLSNPKKADFWREVLASDRPIYVTEGAKKAASLLQFDKAAIALTGVWNGLINRQQLIPDLALFAKAGRKVYICFDSDQISNKNVEIAISSLKRAFEIANCIVINVQLPPETKGVDDFLKVFDIQSFERLCNKSFGTVENKIPELPEALLLAKTFATQNKKVFAFELAGSSWFAYEYESAGIWSQLNGTQMQAVLMTFLEHHYPNNTYSFSYISNVLNFLKPLLMLKELSRPAMTIPFANGLFFLDTFVLKNYEPQFFCTMKLGFGYDPAARCDGILQFFEEATHPYSNSKQLLLGIISLALAQITRFELFFELYGPGGSGKSTFLNLIVAILGKSNVLMTDLSLLENSRFETANLKGKSAILITEGERFSEKSTMLKRLVGNDLIRYERKYEQPGDGFYCRAIVLIATNELIQYGDQTSGLFRRRVVIPFNNSVVPAKRRVLISFDSMGNPIGDFVPELPGLANHVVNLLKESNLSSVEKLFTNPLHLAAVQAGTLASIEDNPLFNFIKEFCLFHPKFVIAFGKRKEFEQYSATNGIYPTYVYFCESRGYHPLAYNRFFSRFLDTCKNQLNLLFVTKFRKTAGFVFLGVTAVLDSTQLVYEYLGPCDDRPLCERVLVRPAGRATAKFEFFEEPIEVFRIKQNECL